MLLYELVTKDPNGGTIIFPAIHQEDLKRQLTHMPVINSRFIYELAAEHGCNDQKSCTN